MTLRQLETSLKVKDGTEHRERAADRLQVARDACNATGLSRDARKFISRELLEAKAVAQEWGVCG